MSVVNKKNIYSRVNINFFAHKINILASIICLERYACRWSWPGSYRGRTDCGSDRAGLLRGSDTGRSPEHWPQGNDRLTSVFCLGRFCSARHPAPFW